MDTGQWSSTGQTGQTGHCSGHTDQSFAEWSMHWTVWSTNENTGQQNGHRVVSGQALDRLDTVVDTLTSRWLSGMTDSREQIDGVISNAKSLRNDLSECVIATTS